MEKGASSIQQKRAGDIKFIILTKGRQRNRLVFKNLLLVLAITTFVGFAYYLFHAGWTTRAPSLEVSPDFSQRAQVVEFERDFTSASLVPSARYLSYLPHSGFHNQRIALENALIMARLLNRTLLVPPIRLGKGILTYYPFDHLHELLVLSGKDGLGHCANPTSWKDLPIECTDYYDYTLIPWQWLTNISAIAAEQPLIQRWDMSDAWLHSYLGVTANDTFTIKDVSLYQHRFVDADPLDMLGSRFEDAVSLSMLSRLSQRHLQLGTVFGSSRLRLRRRHSIKIRKQVRESMVFNNEILLGLASSIEMKLGGQYLAAHVRLGDEQFRRAATKNLRMIWWKLVHHGLGLSINASSVLESSVTKLGIRHPPVIPEDISALRTPHPDLPPLNQSGQQLRCRGELHKGPDLVPLNAPLFISTDANDPSEHPLLRPFFDTFPCTFVLSDFSEEVAELKQLESGYDGLMLHDFLLPFLDAIVAGNAHQIFGTEGSTFSQFVQDVLWRRYHGFEIVQRG